MLETALRHDHLIIIIVIVWLFYIYIIHCIPYSLLKISLQHNILLWYFVLHLSFVKTSKLKALNFPDPYLMHLKPSSTLGLPNKKQTTVSQVNSLAIIFLPQAEDMQVYKAFLWLESSKSRWWMWNLSLPPTFSPISQLQSISKWFSFSSFHLDWWLSHMNKDGGLITFPKHTNQITNVGGS